MCGSTGQSPCVSTLLPGLNGGITFTSCLFIPLSFCTCLIIVGEQVKNLLMKSGLPMPILGHIW